MKNGYVQICKINCLTWRFLPKRIFMYNASRLHSTFSSTRDVCYEDVIIHLFNIKIYCHTLCILILVTLSFCRLLWMYFQNIKLNSWKINVICIFSVYVYFLSMVELFIYPLRMGGWIFFFYEIHLFTHGFVVQQVKMSVVLLFCKLHIN